MIIIMGENRLDFVKIIVYYMNRQGQGNTMANVYLLAIMGNTDSGKSN